MHASEPVRVAPQESHPRCHRRLHDFERLTRERGGDLVDEWRQILGLILNRNDEREARILAHWDVVLGWRGHRSRALQAVYADIVPGDLAEIRADNALPQARAPAQLGQFREECRLLALLDDGNAASANRKKFRGLRPIHQAGLRSHQEHETRLVMAC